MPVDSVSLSRVERIVSTLNSQMTYCEGCGALVNVVDVNGDGEVIVEHANDAIHDEFCRFDVPDDISDLSPSDLVEITEDN